jgi:hypothetical protein
MSTTPTITESGEERFDYGDGLIAYQRDCCVDYPVRVCGFLRRIKVESPVVPRGRRPRDPSERPRRRSSLRSRAGKIMSKIYFHLRSGR